jgi:hypothetical protein
MATERVQDLKEDVNYFVESNTVGRFVFQFLVPGILRPFSNAGRRL